MSLDADLSVGARLTIAIVHFLWVGALLGGASAVAARLLKRRSAGLRYAVHLAILLLMAAALPALYAAVPAMTHRWAARSEFRQTAEVVKLKKDSGFSGKVLRPRLLPRHDHSPSRWDV